MNAALNNTLRTGGCVSIKTDTIKHDEYIQKLLEEPEWELNVIKAYKSGKIDIDKEKFIEFLEQARHRIYLGGYHVYTTVEEADKFVNYLDSCLTLLKD